MNNIFGGIKKTPPIKKHEESRTNQISKNNQELLRHISVFKIEKKDLKTSEIDLTKLEEKLEEIENHFGEFLESCSLFKDTAELRLNISTLSHSITGSRNKVFLLRTNLENKKGLVKIEELKTENKNLKTEIIGITTLIFTAFTFIQLNFQAFSNSASYDIYNRILLFTGINISLFFPIYIIFTFIKHLVNDGENNNFDVGLKLKFLTCIAALVIVSLVTLNQIKTEAPLKLNLVNTKDIKLKLSLDKYFNVPK